MSPVSQPTTGDRRARRKASTRHELLLAGRKLFSDRGLYESRVEEITETADVGKGTLYRYFRNKEALILAVVEAGFEDLRHRVGERTVKARGIDQAVERIVEEHVRFFAENQDLMRIFHQSRGMLKFNRREWRPLRASLEGHLRFLAGLLRRFDGAAPSTATRRRDLAMLLFGGVSGVLSVRVATDPDAEIASLSPLLVGAIGRMTRSLSSSRGDDARGWATRTARGWRGRTRERRDRA